MSLCELGSIPPYRSLYPTDEEWLKADMKRIKFHSDRICSMLTSNRRKVNDLFMDLQEVEKKLLSPMCGWLIKSVNLMPVLCAIYKNASFDFFDEEQITYCIRNLKTYYSRMLNFYGKFSYQFDDFMQPLIDLHQRMRELELSIELENKLICIVTGLTLKLECYVAKCKRDALYKKDKECMVESV